MSIEPEKLSISDERITEEQLNQLFDMVKDKAESEEIFRPLEEPSIYLFRVKELNDANNFVAVKVGDTKHKFYKIRIKQWKEQGYPTLEELGSIPAFINEKGKDGVITRKYFRDHDVHSWLRNRGYQPVWHSTIKETWSCKNELVFPEEITTKDKSGVKTLSQEFYVNKECPNDEESSVTQELLDTFLNEVDENKSEFLKDYFSSSDNDVKIDWTDEKYKVDYSPFAYQKEYSSKLITAHRNVLESHTDNKTLLVSETGSGKTNMLCYAAKGVFSKKDFPMEKVFSEDFDYVGSKNLLLVTSAIPDVFGEIKQAVGTHTHFRNSMKYLELDEVKADPAIINDAWESGFPVVVISVSLQNLAGRKLINDGEKVSEREKAELKLIHEIWNEYRDKADASLVLGDECHFAMFGSGEVYKEALQEIIVLNADKNKNREGLTEKQVKAKFSLKPSLGYIFASATPHKILAQSIFGRESQVIVPPSVINDQKIKSNQEARDNGDPTRSPFFGTPERNVFALSINDIAALMVTQGEKHEDKKFVNEKAVRTIFGSLFGCDSSRDIPPLLSYDTLKKAGIGRHILIQTPSIDSASALDALLKDIGLEEEYKIFRVSSHDKNTKIADHKAALKKHRWGKTITITCDKFVTGVSIPYWDTLIRARGGEDTQGIMQVWGRIYRRWVEEIDGVKYDFKPNCFIIELSPEMVYEIANTVETTYSAVGGGEKDNNPQRIFSWNSDSVAFREMSQADLHKQLESYLKRQSIPELVKRITKNTEILSDFDISEEVFIALSNKKSTLSVKLLDENRKVTDVKVDDSNTTLLVNDNVSDVSLFKENDAKDEELTPEEKKAAAEKATREESIRKGKEEFQKKLDSMLLLLGVIHATLDTKVYNPITLLDLVDSNDEMKTIANNIGLVDFLRTVSRASLLASPHKASQVQTSLKASIAISSESVAGFIEVVNGLSSISVNEVLTPQNVAKLLVDKLELDECKVSDFLKSKNRGVIDVGDKSGNILLEFYNQVLERQGSLTVEEFDAIFKDRVYSIPTSSVTFEIIRSLFKTMKWNEENILWNQELADKNEWLSKNWSFATTQVFLGKTFDKISIDKKVEASFREWVNSNMTDELFDYSISNPPYQSNEGTSKQIYDNFYFLSCEISAVVSMIFPLGWQKSSGKASSSAKHYLIREDRTIISLDNYFELKESPVKIFEAGTGGVCIVLRNASHDNKNYVKYFEYGIFVKEKNIHHYDHWSAKSQAIFDSIDRWSTINKVPSMKSLVTGRNPFGVPSFVTTDKSRPEHSLVTKAEKTENSVRLWSRDIEGKEYVWWWVKNTFRGLKTFDKWALIWPITGPAANWRSSKVIPPKTAASDTFIAAFFSTRDEAENFATYHKTLFYRFVTTESATSHHSTRKVHNYAPDLSLIMNPRTGKIGWKSDWNDDDLRTLFKDVLSESDWKYITEIALASDSRSSEFMKAER